MPVGAVVLTPATDGDPVGRSWPARTAAAAEALAARGVAVLDLAALTERGPDPAEWVARCAVAMLAADLPGPVLLVATGAAGTHLPALGFAQRAARRPVAGYLLVDAEPPRVEGDWPDAPVTVLLTLGAPDQDRAADARRRGWEVLADDDLPAALVALAARP